MSESHLCIVASYGFLTPYTSDFLTIAFPLRPGALLCEGLYVPVGSTDLEGADAVSTLDADLSAVRQECFRMFLGERAKVKYWVSEGWGKGEVKREGRGEGRGAVKGEGIG